jgi:hypothetical protein
MRAAGSAAGSAAKLHSVAAATSGMRRVDCVRMVEGDRRPRFFVVGIGHRFPVEREVDAAVALALLEQVPCRYEWRGVPAGVS